MELELLIESVHNNSVTLRIHFPFPEANCNVTQLRLSLEDIAGKDRLLSVPPGATSLSVPNLPYWVDVQLEGVVDCPTIRERISGTIFTGEAGRHFSRYAPLPGNNRTFFTDASNCGRGSVPYIWSITPSTRCPSRTMQYPP